MDIIIIILLLLLINSYLIKYVSQNYKVSSSQYLWGLFIFHFLISIGYFIYTFYSRSDSSSYYIRTSETTLWFSLFEKGTKFIGFVAWPFINYLNLSYYAIMILFSYIGYLGILLFYLVLNENIELQNSKSGITTIELVFLLPNLHFWTSSLGKGSLIFFGIGFFVFGLSRINRRVLITIFGAFLIYMIRPHILLCIVISVAIGIFLTNFGMKPIIKWFIFICAIILFLNISDSVLKFTDTDSLDITSSVNISHRAAELSKSDSGLDITQYNTLFKLFTFCFRPLFLDGLGVLGFIASIENAFCLFMAIIVIRYLISNWADWNGFFRIGILIFVLGSFVLSQVSGNLGIILRQKSQFTPFLYLLYCKAVSIRSNQIK